MMVASPLGGRLSGRFGSKVPLVLGSTITMLAFVLLAIAHSAHWQVYLAALLLGIGVGFAFVRWRTSSSRRSDPIRPASRPG
jgi:MFS family permease